MRKKLTTVDNQNSFALTDQRRQRNRAALRTVTGLIFIYLLTVVPVRVGDLIFMILRWAMDPLTTNFYIIVEIAGAFLNPIYNMVFYSTNILNIFICARIIPDFRKFFLYVFTLGISIWKKKCNKLLKAMLFWMYTP